LQALAQRVGLRETVEDEREEDVELLEAGSRTP
jgi:hypothetical protein